MERLRRTSFEARPTAIVKKTIELLREFPDFKKQVQSAFAGIETNDDNTAKIIGNHYGTKYEEMGFCTKAFADMISSQADNTDIGICATEFYVFIDILDDMIDDSTYSLEEKATILNNAKQILKGERTENNQNDNFQAMFLVTKDLRQRVINLSQKGDGIDRFIQRGCQTIDALYKETKPQSQERTLVRLADVGRKCAYPLMELINCKLGKPLPYLSVGNLVGIGNILDDYWDLLKDKKRGKQTFLTMSIPEKYDDNFKIILKSLTDLRTHQLALYYLLKLFSGSMGILDKNCQESAIAIALFAQIGVIKRRYESAKKLWRK